LALALEAQAVRLLLSTKGLARPQQVATTQAQAPMAATLHLVHTSLCQVRVQRPLVFLTQQVQQVRVMPAHQAQLALLVELVVRTQSAQHFLVPPSYRFMLVALLAQRQLAAVELERTVLVELLARCWQSQAAAAAAVVVRLTQQRAQWQQQVLAA